MEGERGDRRSPTPEQEGDDFPCEMCERVCKSKAGLTIHVKRMHAVSREKVKFTCQDCEEVFDQEANLRNHDKVCTKLKSSDPTKRKCNICLNEYKKSYFSKHIKKCRGEDQQVQEQPAQARVYRPGYYICEGCGQERAKTNRSRHRNICPGGEGVL